MKKLILKLAQIPFVHNAIHDQADLSAFKHRPTVREIIGIGAIGFSYVIGWPLIAVLSALSIYVNQPLLIIIGGPVAYGLSHLVFLLGMYLAGARYSRIFLRWLTRITILRLIKISKTADPPDRLN